MLARYSIAFAASYFIDRTILSNDADIQTSLRGIDLDIYSFNGSKIFCRTSLSIRCCFGSCADAECVSLKHPCGS